MNADLSDGNKKLPLGDLGVNLQNPIFKTLSTIADKNNTEVYVIGGFVRDLFLKRPSKDIDVVVVGSGKLPYLKTSELPILSIKI